MRIGDAMNIHITICKIDDDSDFADYTFGISEEHSGKLRLYKSTGELLLLEPVAGDEKNALCYRAAYKLKIHWESGEDPDTTCWTS